LLLQGPLQSLLQNQQRSLDHVHQFLHQGPIQKHYLELQLTLNLYQDPCLLRDQGL
jgi:hypothetical protein